MSSGPAGSRWQRFWNRGGWWRAVGLALGYLALYLLFGQLVGLLFGDRISADLLTDPRSVFLALVLPIAFGSAVLVIFVRSVRWTGELFGPQPVPGRRWMWIAVVVIVIPIVLRLFAISWSAYAVSVVLTVLLAGLFIGFAEELLTRGLAVQLLRRGGYGERLVMVLSSVVFALLHSVNALSGQPLLTLAITIVYTFGYGVMMYLVLRVTGRLVWPMLLHAATDPVTVLASGGVDTSTASAGAAGLLMTAGLFNYLYVLLALVAVILVRDRPVRSREAVTA